MNKELFEELQNKVGDLFNWCQENNVPFNLIYNRIDEIQFEQRFIALSNFYASKEMQKQNDKAGIVLPN